MSIEADWIWGSLVGMVLIFGFAVWFLRVPPVPTLAKEVRRVLSLANVTEGDVVFDLGAGDGRLVAEARRMGAVARGWELNPVVWLVAQLRHGWHGVALANMWSAPVEEADVVLTFLMPQLMPRVEREIWARMKVGSRLVSNAFSLPNVRPDQEQAGIYLYIKK